MNRAASWLLLVTGILLLLSGAAHALLGLPAVQGELEAANVADDVGRGIAIGWSYGSAAMLTFGVVVLTLWWKGRTGSVTVGAVALPISLLYLAFGAWAFAYSSLSPHFIGFMVLGALLGAACLGLRGRP
jgi:hypothetical protein